MISEESLLKNWFFYILSLLKSIAYLWAIVYTPPAVYEVLPMMQELLNWINQEEIFIF